MMLTHITEPFRLGKLSFPHRLIQGPLAGYSCAPFRQLFALYASPAYAVTEMISAYDVVHHHQKQVRYLYRAPAENRLCYQLAGSEPLIMAEAALKLEALGGDLIDINAGCPKTKIRKKGAGSALLDTPARLLAIVEAVRAAIRCPLTVKIRLQGEGSDVRLARQLADAGVDALIVHGRRWQDGYDQPCDFNQIACIKQALSIPVIANGDVSDSQTLVRAYLETKCDAFMVARASTGKPWLFQSLLSGQTIVIENSRLIALFIQHLEGLAALESEHQAVLQSRSLLRYYFGDRLTADQIAPFYNLTHIQEINMMLDRVYAN